MATVKKPKRLKLFTPRRRWEFFRDYQTVFPATSILSRHGTINGEPVQFYIHAEESRMEVWFNWRGICYGVNHELIHSLVKMSTEHNNGLLHFELDEPAE